jgi:hypothetical protein
MRTRRIGVFILAMSLVATVAGCTAGRGGSDAPGVALPRPPVANGVPEPGGAPLDISQASQQDIAAALRASGVDEPESWAKVIIEHRPYPRNDPNQGKLRQVLAAAHADPATSQRILTTLAP